MKHTKISTLRQLANYLGTDEEFIGSFPDDNVILVDHRSPVEIPEITESLTIVDVFYIPKKKKGHFRKVFAVRSERFRSILLVLEKEFSDMYIPPDSVHGYIKKRGIRTNAEKHLAKKILLSVDIKNFFETITQEMVYDVLIHCGFTPFASNRISRIVTVNGFLVQGFATSSVISNMVAYNMDIALSELCSRGIVYTRYSDDLYFSTNDQLPAILEIEDIIVNNGFKLNQEKTKLMKRGSRQYVTGLTVFDNKIPRISKMVKRNLRLEVHYIKKFGFVGHLLNKMNFSLEQYENIPEIKKEVDKKAGEYKNRLLGRIFFINGIEKRTAIKFLDIIKERNKASET